MQFVLTKRIFIEKLKRELAEAKNVAAQQYKEKSSEKTIQRIKPPPSGASPNGHWHGDEWHDEPHEVKIVLQFQKQKLR